MTLIIHYYHPIRQSDLILSIDNVVADYSIARPERRDQLVSLLKTIELHRNANIASWVAKKPGTFRQQFSVRFPNDTSFWVGIGLNGSAALPDRVRLEFNPNKVGSNPHFLFIRDYVSRNSRLPVSSIRRFDLAIDIPTNRQHCFLVKDRRMYLERRHGEEFTQYLGAKSSTVGRVKLYNKSLESCLDTPLTRLELTLDPTTPYDKVNFPVVYRLKSHVIENDSLRVTDTDLFILNALLCGYGALDELGRKTKAKMARLLSECTEKIIIQQESYKKILDQLHQFT